LFITLGLLNMRRHLGKTVLGLLSVAAASTIVSFVSAGQSGTVGPSGDSFAHLRAYCSGDLVLLRVPMGDPRRDVQGTALRLQRLAPDLKGEVSSLFPRLFDYGYLAQGHARTGVKPWGDETLRALSEVDGVVDVVPVYHLPAYVGIRTGSGASWCIRARDVREDVVRGFQDRIIAGRPFNETDRGRPVALVQGRRCPVFLGTDKYDERYPYWEAEPPAVGSSLTVRIPSIVRAGEGFVYDYSRTLETDLEVVGQFDLPTRLRSVPRPSPVPTDVKTTIQLFWPIEQILVPQETLLELYRTASHHPDLALSDLPSWQVGLRVDDLTRARVIAGAVRDKVGGVTVLTPSDINLLVETRGLDGPPNPTTVPPSSVRPVDCSALFSALCYATAGLLLVLNFITLVEQRNVELGVLRALGARRFDILTMILTEAIAISLLGATVGFIIAHLPAPWTLMSNDVPPGEVLRRMSREAGQILQFAVLGGLMAGMYPAWRAASRPVLDNLRRQ